MQQLQGQFPGGAGGSSSTVLRDSASGGGNWSLGARIVLPLSAQPTIVSPWTIYGYAVQGQGALVCGGPLYGLLGKLYASLLVGGTFAPTPPGAVFQQPPAQALANLATLWDGTQDPPFPQFSTATQFPSGGNFQGGLQLPQPQRLGPGDQLALGLWLSPSLTSNVETIIYNASFSVLYDTK